MKKLLFLSLFLFFINYSFSQIVNSTSSDTVLYLITKTDGTAYTGKILSDDGREVLIETQTLGKIFIPKSTIKSIEKITDKSSIIGGKYEPVGPFTTRHAFTTNALPIKKGENYAMVNLYGPEVHFALSDRFNFGIMSTWIASPLAIAMKYSIPTSNPNLNYSVGTLIGTSGYFDSFSSLGGLHFANVTSGNRKKNITFSAGYGYLTPVGFNSSIDFIHGAIFSIAGIAKVGAKASFVFDSMFGNFGFNDGSSDRVTAIFLMPGIRFQTKENRAFQASLAGVTIFGGGYISSFPLPTVSWFYKF
jgi:hypothetical protein